MAENWIEEGAPTNARVWLGWLAGLGFVAALVVGGWGLAQLWRSNLPDPVAIHWGTDGVPDGTATLDGTINVLSGLGVAGLVVLGVLGVALHRNPRLLRGWMTGLAPVVALAPASLVLTLLPNLGARTWEEAYIAGWELLPALVLPGAAALVAWHASAAPARLLAVGPDIPVRAPVAQGRAPYHERNVMRAMLWIAGAVLVTSVVATVVLGEALLVLGVVLAAALAWFSVYRYQVTDHGVVVSFGLVGPPRRRVPIEEIEGASVADLRPSQWGGWGYRTNGRDWAVVTRSGPGAHIALAGRRSLALTSDDPRALVARVNGAVTRFWGTFSRSGRPRRPR